MNPRSLDGLSLIARLQELGQTGRDEHGRLTRLAGSDHDRAGRDLFVDWARKAGLEIVIDRIGNIFAVLDAPEARDAPPVMIGSHIDTVVDAGTLDGCYGVLAGLCVLEALKESGIGLSCPIVLGAFTNEEGVRYAPDMMGSLVYAGRLPVEEALAARSPDGTVLGEELARIGYAGPAEPWFAKPRAYVELHIEQGPVLEREGVLIGAVTDLQGISWQRVTFEGVANHAGTTPTRLRQDAGLAAARAVTFLGDRARRPGSQALTTVGCMAFEPNAINVIPSRAVFTLDLRSPDQACIDEEERVLATYLKRLADDYGVSVHIERLARSEPVVFDAGIVSLVEATARARGLSVRRMTSGAGHDAQMIASLCPAAMIFVPSRDGISHNPREHSDNMHLITGAEVLLDVVVGLASSPSFNRGA